MIERLKETGKIAFGFRVIGKLSAADLRAFEPQLEFFIAQRKKHPIGILADLTEMSGAEWKATWEDMRFLQKHTDHIARMAVLGAHGWDALAVMLTSGVAILESETRYFDSSEVQYAWQWARSAKYDDEAPVRVISSATGIWKDYRPEFMDV